jgi:hypothetical protein
LSDGAIFAKAAAFHFERGAVRHFDRAGGGSVRIASLELGIRDEGAVDGFRYAAGCALKSFLAAKTSSYAGR